MIPTRLYKAQYVEHDEDFSDDFDEFEPEYVPMPDPEGWAEYCLEKWGEHKPFFWPSDRPIYRSRSSAQARVDLINRWGGDAVLVECDVTWTPTAVANARRARVRREARIRRLEAEVGRLREEAQSAWVNAMLEAVA